MKLAVSNIAWDNSKLSEHLALLHDSGCEGVELAPSCIWQEPIEAPASDRARIKALVRASGLELTGFHALLFTRPDLQLFQDRAGLDQTAGYLIELAQLCCDLEGTVLILGSPRNRVRHGRDYGECLDWGVDAFSRIATACEPLGVTLCIEPLGPDETEFVMSAREGAALVRRVNHPNFRLHLDAKALLSTGENLGCVLEEHGKLLRHFHVGDPGLAPPGSTGADHAPFGQALRRANYQHYVSIEMRRGHGDSREVVSRSIAYVTQHYLEAAPAAIAREH